MSLLHFLGPVNRRDEKPLYAYACDNETLAALKDSLSQRLRRGDRGWETAAAFAFWSAAYIRAQYESGPLKWELLREGLAVSLESAAMAELAGEGLAYFGRKVRRSDGERNQYLFTLLAEGGVPERMLAREDSAIRRAILGLIQDLERHGAAGLDPGLAIECARMRAQYLPDVFHNVDGAEFLAQLGLSLAVLRRALPAELPRAAAAPWLDGNRPGWRQELPLRLSVQTLATLVVPALLMEAVSPEGGPPLTTRMLRRDESGTYAPAIAISRLGWLPALALPASTQGLKLRLVGGEAVFYGDPEPGGWRVERTGRGDPAPFWPMTAPFTLAAYADGRTVGEAVVNLALPDPDEGLSFWRDDGDGGLTLHAGPPRTRAPELWLLAGVGVAPVVGEGLTLGPVELAAGGTLRRLSGEGELRIGAEVWRVCTGASQDETSPILEARGPILAGWRDSRGGLVFLGVPELYLAYPQGAARRLTRSDWRETRGRGLCDAVFHVVRDATARARITALPGSAVLELRETREGGLTLSLLGLNPGWRVTLQAGGASVSVRMSEGESRLSLSAPATPTPLARLIVSDPVSGRSIELEAPWPARFGMILSPQGERLTRERRIAIDDVAGWRIVAPGSGGRIYLRRSDGGEITIAALAEFPVNLLAAEMRALLALGGPDAKVSLQVDVLGCSSPRLIVGRYQDIAAERADRLEVGVPAENPRQPGIWDGEIEVCAIEIEDGEARVRETTARELDLRSWLGDEGGLWLVLARLRTPFGPRVQRPFVWRAKPAPASRRDDRIRAYAEVWKRLTHEAQNAEWERAWATIEILRERGDIGFLDRVQALAQAPAALVKYAYLTTGSLHAHFETDRFAPFLWATIPLADFLDGVRGAMAHLHQRLAGLDVPAHLVADQMLARSELVFRLRPELGAHIGLAVAELGLAGHLSAPAQIAAMLKYASRPSALACLQQLAQQAARRFSDPPGQVTRLEPLRRPPRLDFAGDIQRLVDAPLVAAEMALGRRPPPSLAETLALALWRIKDGEYFNAAVAAAVEYGFNQK